MENELPLSVQRAAATEELFALNEIRGELSATDNETTEIQIAALKARIGILDELIDL